MLARRFSPGSLARGPALRSQLSLCLTLFAASFSYLAGRPAARQASCRPPLNEGGSCATRCSIGRIWTVRAGKSELLRKADSLFPPSLLPTLPSRDRPVSLRRCRQVDRTVVFVLITLGDPPALLGGRP